MASQLLCDIRNDPVLGSALAYWERKCGSRPIPGRRDINATEIAPSLLPFLQLTERVESTGRIRYRLIGTGIVDAYGADLTANIWTKIIPPSACVMSRLIIVLSARTGARS